LKQAISQNYTCMPYTDHPKLYGKKIYVYVSKRMVSFSTLALGLIITT